MAGKSTGSGPVGAGGQLSAQVSEEFRNLVDAAARRLVAGLSGRIGDITERLTEYTAKGAGGTGGAALAAGARKLAEGKSPLQAIVGAGVAGGKEKLKQMVGGGSGDRRGKGKLKVTNIVEAIDVGVPVRVAYNQWTQFEEFPSFMKKVENVEQESEGKLTWKAQVFWSHRTWESTIIEQVPDKRIIWRSAGEKGSVDGSATFHELAPELTRIVLVLEYHPQGLFERTGNIWRAQGRRVRLELKHFVRHVMTQTILHADEVEGWRGEIRDGRVVNDHPSPPAKEKRRRQVPKQRREYGDDEVEEPVEEPVEDEVDEPERPATRAPRRSREADGQRPRPAVRRSKEPTTRAAARRPRTTNQTRSERSER